MLKKKKSQHLKLFRIVSVLAKQVIYNLSHIYFLIFPQIIFLLSEEQWMIQFMSICRQYKKIFSSPWWYIYFFLPDQCVSCQRTVDGPGIDGVGKQMSFYLFGGTSFPLLSPRRKYLNLCSSELSYARYLRCCSVLKFQHRIFCKEVMD